MPDGTHDIQGLARAPTAWSSRVAAVVEVLTAFALMHVAFRSLKRFTGIGRWEWENDANFSAGAMLILAALGFIAARGKGLAAHGISVRGLSRHATTGLVCVLVYGLVAAIAIAVGLRRDAGWTSPSVGITASLLHLAVSLIMLWVLRRWGARFARWPAWIGIVLVIVLPLAPILPRLLNGDPVRHTAITVLSIILSAAIAEEVFFFGYMQSRLNHAFGRSWRVLGTHFGPGLLITAFLFGVVHALNPYDYFQREGRLAWWWGLSSALSLFHGLLRERTGSIVAPAIVHAFMDIASRAPGLIAGSP